MLGFCVGVLLIACVNVMNMQFAGRFAPASWRYGRRSAPPHPPRATMLTRRLLVPAYWARLPASDWRKLAIDWLSATLRNLDNPPPSWITFDVDALVLTVTVGGARAAVVSGLLPAWTSSRASTVSVLRDGNRGNTNRSVSFMTRGLVVFQSSSPACC
jgi:hypothetical protein